MLLIKAIDIDVLYIYYMYMLYVCIIYVYNLCIILFHYALGGLFSYSTLNSLFVER